MPFDLYTTQPAAPLPLTPGPLHSPCSPHALSSPLCLFLSLLSPVHYRLFALYRHCFPLSCVACVFCSFYLMLTRPAMAALLCHSLPVSLFAVLSIPAAFCERLGWCVAFTPAADGEGLRGRRGRRMTMAFCLVLRVGGFSGAGCIWWVRTCLCLF